MRGAIAIFLVVGAPVRASAQAPAATTSTDDTAMMVEAGQWMATSTILDVGVPPATDPAMAETMRAMRSALPPMSVCLPVKATASGVDVMDFLRRKCPGATLAIVDGRFTSAMTCGQGADAMTAALSGTYTPTRIEFVADTVAEVPDGTMTMKTRIIFARTGPCDTTKDAPR